MERLRTGLKKIEKAAWITAATSFGVELFTTLSTSGLTTGSMLAGVSAFLLRKTFPVLNKTTSSRTDL